MQYTTHYNLNLPEGGDIVNPLVQDNPNYSAIDAALYNNKLRVIGNATHVKTGTNHAITLADSDIAAFKFVATGDYVTGDTFTVDGVTVTARVADGSSIPNGAFKINSTVLCILDGTLLNLINVESSVSAGDVSYDNNTSGLNANNAQDAIDELANDSGWVTINPSYDVKYRYFRGVVYITCDVTDVPANTFIGSLPSTLAPANDVYIGNAGAPNRRITVTVSGNVYINGSEQGAVIASGSYPV